MSKNEKKPSAKPGKNAIKDPAVIAAHPERELPRFRQKYEQLCTKYGCSTVDKFVKKMNKEANAWKGDVGERKFEYRMGDKGGDFPPNIPFIFAEPLSYAQTRAVIDSFAFWPAVWKYMNIVAFWKTWGAEAKGDEQQCNGDDGAMLIHEFLKTDSADGCNLQNLEMIGNGITARGCSYIGRALTQNECLKYLNLSYNRSIGDEGAAALGTGLKWNSTLEVLKLEYCGIGWAGGEEIGRNIVRASSIKELYLKGNTLGAKGVKGIAQALPKNVTLTHLDLSDNCFGIHLMAIEALREGIESNDSLTSIDLNLNSLVPAGTRELVDMLKAKPKIEVFHIYERAEDHLFEQILAETKAHVDKKKKAGKKGKKGKK